MMKLSNFRYLAMQDGYKLAAVDETTGWGPWRRVVTHKVFLEPRSSYWRFLDTGDITPDHDVEKAAIAAAAREALKSHMQNSTIDGKP